MITCLEVISIPNEWRRVQKNVSEPEPVPISQSQYTQNDDMVSFLHLIECQEIHFWHFFT